MPKFSRYSAVLPPRAPVQTSGNRMWTHEGGIGWERDAKSELFLLAVSNLVGEDAFYEAKDDRDRRFVDIACRVTTDDPEWVAALVPYLRNTMQMRSAAVVLAASYAAAGGPNARRVVAAALSRADEPAEMIGYWHAAYGRHIPKAVKRGIADAATRLYTEGAALKYDGKSRGIRMADVLELVHPTPKSEWQSALFAYLLDVRHHPDEIRADLGLLPMIAANRWLEALPENERRGQLEDQSRLGLAGFTWERLSGWLPGGMDAAAWEAIIPSMGYMALLRNLRNFDQAGVSDEVASTVAATLADPDEVARSRQFPIRFYSAFQEIGSLRWAGALEKALDASLRNVPHLTGRTLILIDVSGSMYDVLSQRSSRSRKEIAAVFGLALAKRCDADVVAYDNQAWEVRTDGPLLTTVAQVRRLGGGGTATFEVLNHFWDKHDRVVILTDEQAHDAGGSLPDTRIYTFNLAGYRPAQVEAKPGQYTFGGLTDAGFRLLSTLEANRDAEWEFV